MSEEQTITDVLYEIGKKAGRFPSDTLITVKRDSKEVILKPLKDMSHSLRCELLLASFERGWDLVIEPNGGTITRN